MKETQNKTKGKKCKRRGEGKWMDKYICMHI